MKKIVLLSLLLVLLYGCREGHRPGQLDLGLRAHVDNYNKAAFINRYDDPSCAIHEAQCALALLHDSLPTYHDGRLRAYNNPTAPRSTSTACSTSPPASPSKPTPRTPKSSNSLPS